MEYLLDTNVLIEGNNRWCRRDVFPSVWDYLADQNNVYMLKQVFDELRYPDDLVTWVRTTYESRLVKADMDILNEYNLILDWISDCKRWHDSAVREWNKHEKADPWLIATAKSRSQTIVTFDGAKNTQLPNVGVFSSKEPKITAVSNVFHVRVITFYDLLQELGLRV